MDLRLTPETEALLKEAGFAEEVLDFTEPTGEGFVSGGRGRTSTRRRPTQLRDLNSRPCLSLCLKFSLNSSAYERT